MLPPPLELPPPELELELPALLFALELEPAPSQRQVDSAQNAASHCGFSLPGQHEQSSSSQFKFPNISCSSQTFWHSWRVSKSWLYLSLLQQTHSRRSSLELPLELLLLLPKLSELELELLLEPAELFELLFEAPLELLFPELLLDPPDPLELLDPAELLA